MARRCFRDYGIRPKGSPEISYDPFILAQMLNNMGERQQEDAERKKRVANVFRFILKTALTILPPKQRKIFYSVWVRSEGKLNKGVMEYSRKTDKSHFTSYNNWYKAMNSLRNYLDRTGYTEHIIKYLKGQYDELPESEG